MSITGSTRMQATSIQLAVLLTILEMTVRDLLALPSASVPADFCRHLDELYASLNSPAVLAALAQLVSLEESVYRSGRKNNYFAGLFAVDVLTDTTERSPTYCTPAFRKFDDATASPSWAFLFLPQAETAAAWHHVLKRNPRCVAWSEAEVDALVPAENRARTREIIRKISASQLMRFRIGLDGLPVRPVGAGDSVIAVVSAWEHGALLEEDGFFHRQLTTARQAGAQTGLLFFSTPKSIASHETDLRAAYPGAITTIIPVPETKLLLDGVARLGVKLVMNALSTCTMVRLGRVMGNYMIWVVPSNLKLIDRATRYIARLTGLNYETANALLFEIIEYIEPRMKADQVCPPAVGMAVLRVRERLTNEEAEARLLGQ